MKACAQKCDKKMKGIISTIYIPKRCLHRLNNDNWINYDMEPAHLYVPNTLQDSVTSYPVVYMHIADIYIA